MRRLQRWSALAVLGLTVSACATMNVSSHVERGLDFSQYQTWDWGAADALPSSDARLDNPFFRDNLQGAVELQLHKHGLERSTGEVPDLLVHYHANVAPRIDPNGATPDTGACYDEDCTVRVMEREVGTILIDVLDGQTNRLVWRGWAQTNLEGVLNNPPRFHKRIAAAVTGMFAQFPR